MWGGVWYGAWACEMKVASFKLFLRWNANVGMMPRKRDDIWHKVVSVQIGSFNS